MVWTDTNATFWELQKEICMWHGKLLGWSFVLKATWWDIPAHCIFDLYSAFNPPVAGSEDHNDQGVYPVVDDAGNKIYDYSIDDLQELIKPPEVMAKKNK